MYFLAKHTGLKPFVIGENGGVAIENSPSNVTKLAEKTIPLKAFELIKNEIDETEELLTIPRLTEVVLKRTFDINRAINIVKENNLEVDLIDSKYSYHITEKGMNKATGFKHIVDKLIEAVNDPKSHRYSASKGIPGLRKKHQHYIKKLVIQ